MQLKEVTLPVGIDHEGTRHRKVVITEMNGYDEENLTSKRVRNNGSKAQTILLQRCIQEIPGVAARKTRPNDLLSPSLIKKMTSYDRDFLFLEIRTLGLDDEDRKASFQYSCPECGYSSSLQISLEDLPVYEWPEDEPLSLDIEFLRPITIEGKERNKGKWFFLNGKQQEVIAGVPQEKSVSQTIALCLRELDGEEVSLVDEDARRLTSNERNFIFEQVLENSPGIDSRIKNCCEACSHEWDEVIEFSRFFEKAARRKNNASPQPKKRLRKLRKT